MRLPKKYLGIFFVISIAIYGGIVFLGLYYATGPSRIADVSVDDSSVWGKYFLSETGFPFLTVKVKKGNRCRTEGVAFVGNKRSLVWFEQLGFKSYHRVFGRTEETEILIQGMPGANFFNKKKQQVTETGYVIEHPMKRLTLFYYLPRTGMLSFMESTVVPPEKSIREARQKN